MQGYHDSCVYSSGWTISLRWVSIDKQRCTSTQNQEVLSGQPCSSFNEKLTPQLSAVVVEYYQQAMCAIWVTNHLQAAIFSGPVQMEQTYWTIFLMTAFSELVVCLSLTTIQGTQVWAGLSLSVATEMSYISLLPSAPVAQVLMAFQSSPYLVAQTLPWATKSVVFSSRQRAKGSPWVQNSYLRVAQAWMRLPWHSLIPCWQENDQLLPFWVRRALPQGYKLNSQIFQKSLVSAAGRREVLMKARQSGQRDQEQRSILTLPSAVSETGWSSWTSHMAEARAKTTTMAAATLLLIVDFQSLIQPTA